MLVLRDASSVTHVGQFEANAPLNTKKSYLLLHTLSLRVRYIIEKCAESSCGEVINCASNSNYDRSASRATRSIEFTFLRHFTTRICRFLRKVLYKTYFYFFFVNHQLKLLFCSSFFRRTAGTGRFGASRRLPKIKKTPKRNHTLQSDLLFSALAHGTQNRTLIRGGGSPKVLQAFLPYF